MAYEVITLNLIPSGEVPVIHAAQFDVNRPLMFALKLGADDFDPSTYDLELQIRKVDNNIVTAAPASRSGNVVTFNSTEQMTACSGTNLGEIQITKGDLDIATLHFYLVVQRDVLAGGVSSASDIYNLTEQIAEIVPQVIGDDYYTKEEVDEKIAEIPTFDPTNYYDKADVNALLNDKADVADLPDMTDYYTKSEVDTKITDLYQIKTESGSIVHITDGGNAIPVKSLVSEIVAVQSGSGTPSPSNPRAISGFSSGVITVTDNVQITNTYTFTFGQTVYGGYFDNKGNLVVTHKEIIFDGSENWQTNGDRGVYISTSRIPNIDTSKPILFEEYQTIASGQAPVNDGQANYNSVRTAIQIHDERGMTNDAYTTFLANHNIKMLYFLANPITLVITSQDIPTLSGENNIFSNTGDVEVKYFTEKSDGIAELIKSFM